MEYRSGKLCKECQGQCCKRMPGSLWPNDLTKASPGEIKKLLKTGDYAVDYWEGDVREGQSRWEQSYYIRPATIEGKQNGDVVDPSWGGTCVFLSGDGCKLKRKEMPFGCKSLEPRKDGDCVDSDGGKKGGALAWVPHRRAIKKALDDLAA